MVSRSNDSGDNRVKPSTAIITSEFPRSLGLVTISVRRSIIGVTAEEGRRRFALLMSKLKDIEANEGPFADQPQTLAWVIRGKQKGSKNEDFLALRAALNSLDEPVREWLAERAIFVIANPDRLWMERCAESIALPAEDFGSSNKVLTRRIFDAFSREAWASSDAITAFVQTPSGRESKCPTLSYYAHRAPSNNDWSEGPVGEARRSNSKIRDQFVKDVFKAHRALGGTTTERAIQESIPKLFRAGLTIFEFDEFMAIS